MKFISGHISEIQSGYESYDFFFKEYLCKIDMIRGHTIFII